MDYIRNFYLDVNAVENRTLIKAKQGDKALRLLGISLLKDGVDFTPTGVAKYQFRCSKPDGNAVVLESAGSAAPIVANNGVYTVTLSEQCLAVAGRCVCDFVMLDSSDNILSSSLFFLDVVPMPDIGSIIESSTEWQELMGAIHDAETFANIVAFRVNNGNFQYTVDGSTWVTICEASAFGDPITNSQIDALFT